MTKYAIEAALYKLPLPGKFGHNFWVLRDVERDIVIAQLHGLATSRITGKILPIGFTKNHSLRAYHFVYSGLIDLPSSGDLYLKINECQTIVMGDAIIEIWLQGVRAMQKINQLDLDYPSCGFCVPLTTTINSNSIYHTFADCMHLEAYRFPNYRQIGIENSITYLLTQTGGLYD